jgi:hypothetical protein
MAMPVSKLAVCGMSFGLRCEIFNNFLHNRRMFIGKKICDCVCVETEPIRKQQLIYHSPNHRKIGLGAINNTKSI